MGKSFINHSVLLFVMAMVPFGLTAQVGQNSSTGDSSRRDGSAGGFITGGSSVYRYSPGPEINCGVSRVSFQKGARTIWHSHAGAR